MQTQLLKETKRREELSQQLFVLEQINLNLDGEKKDVEEEYELQREEWQT